MDFPIARGRPFGGRLRVVALFFTCFHRFFTDLLRPGPASRLVAGLVVTALLASLPANALITPTAPVGATLGTFAVSAFGAATYTIPIVVPPGTGGMQPSLTFAYNSQSGNGVMGQGWSVGGLSAIRRCGATVAVDNRKGGISYDADDRFCLDGERLIRLGSTTEYRTQHESLQQVLASDATHNPAFFTLRTKDGLVHEYGSTSDSRIEANPNYGIRLWALSKVMDRHGNYMRIGYEEDAASGDYRTKFITYTANDAQGIVAPNTINFEYEERPDTTRHYEGGAVSSTRKRLTRILVRAGNTLVREYRLAYDNLGAVGGSRLVNVTECGTDGVCLPATTFAYARGDNPLWSPTSAFVPPLPLYSRDYDNEGIALVDVNGDGLVDLVRHLWTSTGSYTGAWLNTGQGWVSAPQYAPPSPIFSRGYDNEGTAFVDVNGDGLVDLVRHLWTPSGTYKNAWLNANGTWVPGGGEFFPPVPLWSRGYDDEGTAFVDVNGDGLRDLLQHVWASGTAYAGAWLNTGKGWISAPEHTPPYPIYSRDYDNEGTAFADVNGDGLVDLVRHLWTSNGSYKGAWLNTGRGWLNEPGYAPPHPLYSRGNTSGQLNRFDNEGTALVDVNGDGLDDLLRHLWVNGATYTGTWINGSTVPDLLVSVRTGLGAEILITYSPLTDQGVYQKDVTATFPYQDLLVGRVVANFSASNGTGGLNTSVYRYEGLKMHRNAAASLGFRRMQGNDPSGLVQVTYHNQMLDGTEGTVALSQTFAGNQLVKEVSNTWTAVDFGNGNKQVRLQTSEDKTYELNGALVAQTTILNSYDDNFGFPTTSVRTYNDGRRVTTYLGYQHDTTNWNLGQLVYKRVTAEAAGFTPQTRVSAFAYNNGLLASETVEPDEPTLTVSTTYTYDAFGNRTGRTVNGQGIAPRSESQTYDTYGQFLVSKTDAGWHTTRVTFDPRTGALDSQTDPNGLVTRWDYDGLGRKTRETRPDGTSSTITYTATSTGYSVTTTSSGAGSVYEYFDILGRPIRSAVQGFGGAWAYKDKAYDSLGRLAWESHPYFSGETAHSITYNYDNPETRNRRYRTGQPDNDDQLQRTDDYRHQPAQPDADHRQGCAGPDRPGYGRRRDHVLPARSLRESHPGHGRRRQRDKHAVRPARTEDRHAGPGHGELDVWL